MPLKRLGSRSLSRRGSASSEDSNQKELEAPVLVYHESARSIVFRDHLRRAAKRSDSNISESNTGPSRQEDARPQAHKRTMSVGDLPRNKSQIAQVMEPLVEQQQQQHQQHHIQDLLLDPIAGLTETASEALHLTEETVVPSEAGIAPAQIAGYRPKIDPLPALEFSSLDTFDMLLDESPSDTVDWSAAEVQVVQALQAQQAVCKTIKNVDWTSFLHRFCFANLKRGRYPSEHNDHPPCDSFPYNSFVTSTTLLPAGGKKMRCFGSPTAYTVGVVFELPTAFEDGTTEEEAAKKARVWSWPSGYSAKTEFNIDSRGRLINGREEAIRSLETLRGYNEEYLTKEEYTVANRLVSGLSQIPYNEVFVRVGGLGRIVNGHDVASGEARVDGANGRSFDKGVGLPSALFVRQATYGHLIAMLRTRARLTHTLGEAHTRGIPLLLVTPELGVRVLTDRLQREFWKIASRQLNPFQDPVIAHKTTVDNTDDACFEQKVEELFDIDDELRQTLTPEECARLAGGFGATDESVARILKQVMARDKQADKEHPDGKEKSHQLQDVVNEGLSSALRSGDYHTARQLLILYSLVSTRGEEDEPDESSDVESEPDEKKSEKATTPTKLTKQSSFKLKKQSSFAKNAKKDFELVRKASRNGTLQTALPAPPPPPPLDTDRLRSATNSDGLLSVLGAAQVLKAMQDGSARKRTMEVISAVEEWVEYADQSMAFRISSWYDQRAAQDDLKIATDNSTQFMAFVSNKAISNRKTFAKELREAATATDFSDVRFLMAIDEVLSHMHSPCLRLELLQYVLGLDNRYSVGHVARSVELAATCLGLSSGS